MSWNNGLERKKFEARMAKQAKEYRAAGMTEEQIKAMYEFDLAQFNSDRAYYSHTQSLDIHEENDEGDEVEDSFVRQFFDDFTVSDQDEYLVSSSRYGWIETIENSALANELRNMVWIDREIITRTVFEGYKLVELETVLDVPYRTLKYHWSSIKEKIANALRSGELKRLIIKLERKDFYQYEQM